MKRFVSVSFLSNAPEPFLEKFSSPFSCTLLEGLGCCKHELCVPWGGGAASNGNGAFMLPISFSLVPACCRERMGRGAQLSQSIWLTMLLSSVILPMLNDSEVTQARKLVVTTTAKIICKRIFLIVTQQHQASGKIKIHYFRLLIQVMWHAYKWLIWSSYVY